MVPCLYVNLADTSCVTFFCCGCLCGRSMSLLTAGLAPVDLTYKLLVALQHRLDRDHQGLGVREGGG